MTGNHWQEAVDAEGNTRKGVYVVDVATGVYKNVNRTTDVIGNREPDLIGGWSNTFTYKNFSFNFLLDFRLGGDVYNGTEYYLTSRGMSKRTGNRSSVTLKNVVFSDDQTAAPQDITYKSGQVYNINGQNYSGDYLIQQYWSSYCANSYNFLTSVNWLKLRSISLSYDFTSLLKNQKIIKGLSATITGYNLLTWTNYKGLDPEVTSAGSGTGGSGSTGIDYLGVPATSSLSFGINVTF